MKFCIICKRPMQYAGEYKTLVIDQPNGLAGVQSTVYLCTDHRLTDPRIVRKRLEDYYDK